MRVILSILRWYVLAKNFLKVSLLSYIFLVWLNNVLFIVRDFSSRVPEWILEFEQF